MIKTIIQSLVVPYHLEKNAAGYSTPQATCDYIACILKVNGIGLYCIAERLILELYSL